MEEKEQINISAEVSFIWKSADILRGTYKAHQFQDVILPMIVLRRMECVLLEEKEKIESKLKDSLSKLPGKDAKKLIDAKLLSSLKFNNLSKFTFKTIASEKDSNIKENFKDYINGFTDNIKKILENFGLLKELAKLEKEKLLHPLIKQYSELDLSPKLISNLKMGYIYEELIRRFSEQSGEEAGEHFTPREIIQLMVQVIIDKHKIKDGELKTLYDPACGSGGMLSVGKDFILDKINSKANVVVFGQEMQPETWAIGASDMLLKGENAGNIHEGNTLTNDQVPKDTFDYMLSNPPFGVDWKKDKETIINDTSGRFHKDRLPRVSDGSTLFLQHMLSKMKPTSQGGSSIAIVFNGSPLFTGDAGSGESEFRKYLLENDLIDCIIALPKDLFYNTGIATYIWVIRNIKDKERKGKVQLINAVDFYEKMKKSLGKKTKYIPQTQIKNIYDIYESFKESEHSKIFDNTEFGYTKVNLELTEVDEEGNPLKETIMKKTKGVSKENTQIKTKNDSEYVPLKEDIDTYLKKEVELPYSIRSKVVGYEINFTQYFFKYQPLRKPEIVAMEFEDLEKENITLLKEIGFV
jgi:type I restriction enzyme M protein